VEDLSGTRFDSIEEAQEYLGLLREVVSETREIVHADMAEPVPDDSGRRVDALRLVDHKLEQLHQHLVTSGRLLNDLRMLRRALYGERQSSRELARTE
jgi:hypothetical protein